MDPKPVGQTAIFWPTLKWNRCSKLLQYASQCSKFLGIQLWTVYLLDGYTSWWFEVCSDTSKYFHTLEWPGPIGYFLQNLRPVKGLVVALLVVLSLLIVSLQLGSEWLFYVFWAHLGKISGNVLEIQAVDVAHVDTHTHTYIYIYTHVYIDMYIHACMHACMHAYIHTYIHTYRRTCFWF